MAFGIWTVTGLVVLVLSFFPLIGVEATAGSKTVLSLAHVAVAAVLIPFFRHRPVPKAAGRGNRPDEEALGSR